MKKSLLLLSLAVFSIGLLPSVSQAHHRSGHSGGPHHSATRESALSTTDGDSFLTANQRRIIESILRDDSNILIDQPTRREIRSQLNSLPPGIQRRLARGRELPPGIAKKIYLPTRINDHIDLNDDVRIVVVGSNAVVVDPVTGLVVDILREILL